MADVTVSNGHIDSLIAYVLDVKPYHTKLSEIVEEYLFEDTVRASIIDEKKMMVVMGRDYLRKSSNPLLSIWANTSPNTESSSSADKVIRSDGIRVTYGDIPTTVVHKLMSSSSQDESVVATYQSQIVGLNVGVFDPRRFDGPGIPNVTLEGTALTESVGYNISNGAFSFIVSSGTEWQSTDTVQVTALDPTSGVLAYADVNSDHGYITNISAPTSNVQYEEWTLTWVDASSHLTVVGSSSGSIGTAAFNVPFVHAKLNFTFTSSPGQDPGLPPMNDGDTFVLTPSNKIVVHQSAPNETWSLIKTNPMALTANPVFSGGAGPTPSLSVYTRSLDRTPATTFTITFTSATTYTLSSSTALTGYPKTGQLAAQSFKDDYVHFTINANGRTFAAGNTFTFTVKANKENYLVYGSVSGWAAPAQIGKWYFNGKIGFKIPALDYFPCVNGSIGTAITGTFTPLVTPHSNCPPCVYTITFRTATKATVFNNIFGFRAGLVVGVDWEDEFCGFKLDGTFTAGDVISVYIAERSMFTRLAGYDELPYDEYPYDIATIEIPFAKNLLQEYLPLFHSHNVVIIPTAVVTDDLVIDKVTSESVRFRLGRGIDDPTLGAELADEDNWLPLEFRINSTFPDYASTIDAYLAADPSVKVFQISQPLATNGNSGLAVFQFDSAFFASYIDSETYFTIRFLQTENYQQTAQVKFTETLNIELITTILLATESGNILVTESGNILVLE